MLRADPGIIFDFHFRKGYLVSQEPAKLLPATAFDIGQLKMATTIAAESE